MNGNRHLDSELYMPACDHARFSWVGREYEGRLALDAGWALGLEELELEPKAYGRELYEAVFPAGSALREGLREALAEAERTASRLRFRLHLSPGLPDWIHALYWELLADDGGRLSLARSPDTAFSRYSTVRSSLGLPAPGRVRILCAVAAPLDAERFRLAEIDRDAVLDRLIAVLGASYRAYEMEILEPPVTLERMRERLVEGGFHLLHLVGHGLLESRGVSALVLENEEGKTRFVGEDLLAELLLGMRELRLVTLMACHGGAPSSSDAFSGLAGRLVERGVPAVLAMRRRIRFDDAELFTQNLYRHLAREGRIDEAVNEARQQLYLKDPQGITWSSPVLYSRLADGSLWQPEAAPPPVVTVVSRFPRRSSAPRLLWQVACLLALLGLWLAGAARRPSVVNKLQVGSPVFQSFVRHPDPVVLRGPLPIESFVYTPSLPGWRRESWLRFLASPVAAPFSSNSVEPHGASEEAPNPFSEALLVASGAPSHPEASAQLESGRRHSDDRPVSSSGEIRGVGREAETKAQDRDEMRWSVEDERLEDFSSLPRDMPYTVSSGGEKGLYKLGLVKSPPSAIAKNSKEAQAHALRDAAVLNAATEAFVTSRRFTMVERKELATVFKEKDLKNFIGKGDSRLVDLLGLDYLGIVGHSLSTRTVPKRITKELFERFDPKGNSDEETKITVWTIDVRLVDVKTGQITKTLTSEGSSRLVPVPTVDAAGDLLHDAIRAAYPPFGVVVKVTGKEVTIDLGESSGLQKKDVFEIVEEGEQLFHPITGKPMEAYLVVIGQVQVTEIWPNMANAKITESQPGKEIKGGCFVRYKSGSGEFLKRTSGQLTR